MIHTGVPGASSPGDGAAPGTQPSGLVRQLGMGSAVAVLVGSAIGSGIFRVPSVVASEVATVSGVALVWIVGGAIALFGALSLAELAGRYPHSGGIYVYLREAYGPGTAFLFGWTQLVLIRPSALGAIAMILAEYLGDFLVLGARDVRVVAVGAIVVVGALNVRSLAWGAVFENLTTGVKVLALALLAFLVLFLSGAAPPAAEAPPTAVAWTGYGVALVAVLWAYDGWADLTFMSGEVRDPERTLPRALTLGVLVVVVLYLLVNAAYLSVLGVGEMAGSELVAADVADRLTGRTGALVVSALVVVSTLGALNGAMMTGPRIFFAMASDGLMVRSVASVHGRFGTPWVAVLLATGLGVAYVSVRSFEQLAGGFVLGIWPFYALAVAAVAVLRRRDAAPTRFRIPGYPVPPLVFLAASFGMLLAALLETPGLTLFGFAIIALGIPVYAVVRPRATGKRLGPDTRVGSNA